MGFLIMDEMFDCWTVAKNPFDYHLFFREWSAADIADTVRRDRNHPSVVVYSAGNEIHDTPKADLAKEILRGLLDAFHANDPSRPVTQALFRPNVSHDYENGLADMLDVIGQNYRENEILAAHDAKPTRKILGTENGHGRSNWLPLRDNPSYAGQFLWSGIDYLGESRAWPVVAAGSGLLDHTGGFKPIAYERQSWWSDKPMVYMARRVAAQRASPTDPGYETGPVTAVRFPQTLFPDWNNSGGANVAVNVEVYSNCEEVELWLNGRSLGSKRLPGDAAPRNWSVPFEPGTLKAVGKNKGQAAATFELHTAGKPAKVMLSVDRQRLTPDFDDVAYVTATVVDADGVMVPDAAQLISFQLKGPGMIAAVDSADNSSHEPFQSSERKAYQGWCIAIVKARAAGAITLSASAPGLSGSAITIESVKK
jgi:beta-galactosidase